MKGSHCSLYSPSQTPLMSVIALSFSLVPEPLLSDWIPRDWWGRPHPQPHISSWFLADRQQILSGLEGVSWDFYLQEICPESFCSYSLFSPVLVSSYFPQVHKWIKNWDKALHLCLRFIFSWGNNFSVEKQPNLQQPDTAGLKYQAEIPAPRLMETPVSLPFSFFPADKRRVLDLRLAVVYYFCQVGKGARGCWGFPVLER